MNGLQKKKKQLSLRQMLWGSPESDAGLSS